MFRIVNLAITMTVKIERKKRFKGFVPKGSKHCYKCNRILPLTSFGKNSASKDGHMSECKECRLRAKRQYYHKHPQRARNEKKRYRQNNLEQVREKNRQWVRDNPEKVKAQRLAYYLTHHKSKNKTKHHGKAINRRSKCEICDSTVNLQNHHFNYDKPLDVHTYCASCHKFIHVIIDKLEKNPHNAELVYLLFGDI